MRAYLRLFVVYLVFFSLARLVFYFAFISGQGDTTAYNIWQAFSLGLRFDARVAALFSLPIFILRGTAARRLAMPVTMTLLIFALLAHATDLGYYAYLQSRVNFTVFHFLKNPLISAQMIWETYNLLIGGAILAGLIYGFHQMIRRFVFSAAALPIAPSPHALSKKSQIIKGILVSVFTLLCLWGSASQYPLRWSDAFFSQNMALTYLAMNPLHYIVDTAKPPKNDYDKEKVRKLYPVVSQYLEVEKPDAEKLIFQRPTPLTPQFIKPNIVYIVMESMAAYKTGVFGNAPDSSPALDELSKNGWLFRHFYVPTEGTARSIFCILTGIPDINAKSTSSRNPLIINQHTYFNAFKDYERFYFIGGSAAWGNMRGVYMNNVRNLEMYEEDRLGGPKTDVWGLSDLDLFRQTARVLSERDQQKPFVALVQSASFHRPYTIPDEHGSFTTKNLSDTELKRYGFASNDEYNSFRFADYSLGEFFRLIKDKEFFKNTIFVIHGDHGLPHNEAEHLKPGYKFFGLNRFHTPLVIYSPLIKKPEEFNMMMSEPDVWPTLAGLAGVPFTNTALGRNVFASPKGPPAANKKHYNFSYVYYTEPLEIMLYDDEFLAHGTERAVKSLHRYLTDDFKADVKDQFPEKFKEMSDLLMGIFETSKYILFHNPKLPED